MSASMSAPGVFTAANCLSFGGTIAGFALGWTSLAADYTVNFPADSSKVKVFAYTYIGLNLPLIFVEVLGAAMMTTFNAKSTWEAAYESHELGGLLGAPLIGPMGGFGRFLLVLLALSIVSSS
jgi:purine-cytosine permease-like protein